MLTLTPRQITSFVDQLTTRDHYRNMSLKAVVADFSELYGDTIDQGSIDNVLQRVFSCNECGDWKRNVSQKFRRGFIPVCCSCYYHPPAELTAA